MDTMPRKAVTFIHQKAIGFYLNKRVVDTNMFKQIRKTGGCIDW